LVVDVFVSVDGWAGSDGLPGYFGYLGPELADWIAVEGAAPQVVLMGRRTYLMLADLPEEVRDEGWHRLSRLEKVVFSRSLTEASWSNTRICSGDLVDEVRGLKAGSDVPLRTVGSLSVARQLLAAGLVDRLRLMIFPSSPDRRGARPPSTAPIPPILNWSTTESWTAGCFSSSTDRRGTRSPASEPPRVRSCSGCPGSWCWPCRKYAGEVEQAVAPM